MTGSVGPWRAKSSDAGSRSGSRCGRLSQTPLNLRPMAAGAPPDCVPASGRADSAAVSPRSGAPPDCPPASGRANSAGPSSRCTTPRRMTPQGHARALACDASPRDRGAGWACNTSPRRPRSAGSYGRMKSYVLELMPRHMEPEPDHKSGVQTQGGSRVHHRKTRLRQFSREQLVPCATWACRSPLEALLACMGCVWRQDSHPASNQAAPILESGQGPVE